VHAARLTDFSRSAPRFDR